MKHVWILFAVLLGVVVPAHVRAATPDVAIAIDGPTGPVAPGQALVYHLYVTNLNATTPTGALLVEANIPQFVAVNRPAQAKCSPKRCDSSYAARFGSVVRWEIKGIAAGSREHRWFRMSIDNTAEFPPPPDNTDLTLDVEVKASGVKVAGTASTVVVQHAARELDLSVSGTTRVAPGGEVDYVLSYGNIGSGTIGATLRAPLPAGTSVISASAGAKVVGNAIEWDLGNLAAGNADHRALKLKLDKKLKPGALVSFAPQILSRNPKQRPTTASLTTSVGEPAPLTLKVSTTPKVGAPGGTVQYQIEVTNTSSAAPTGEFDVTASVPVATSVNRPQAGKCWPARCDSSYRAGPADFIYWTVKTLPPGGTAVLQFNAVVDKPAALAPPPNGTQLVSTVTAHTQGIVFSKHALPVGTAATVGRGKPLAPLGGAPVAKPLPAPKLGRPK